MTTKEYKKVTEEEAQLKFREVKARLPKLFDLFERYGVNCPRCNFPLLRPHVINKATGEKFHGACMNCKYKELDHIKGHKQEEPKLELQARINKCNGYIKKYSIGLPKQFLKRSFNGYQVNNDEMNHAVRTCKRMAKDLSHGRALHGMLMGSTGVGKTYLISATCNAAQYYSTFNLKIQYLSIPIIAEMKNSAIDDREVKKALNTVMLETEKADLVILDDLGAERNNEWSKAIVSDIMQKREDKAVLITTNLTDDEGNKPLSRYSSPTISRIKYHMNSDDCVIFNNTADYRVTH